MGRPKKFSGDFNLLYVAGEANLTNVFNALLAESVQCPIKGNVCFSECFSTSIINENMWAPVMPLFR